VTLGVANGDVKPATWHWFGLRGRDDRPMLSFPGVWRRYQGPVKKDGPKVDIEVYAFLTTTPNKLVATINHERMPVLLTREDEFDAWLNGAPHLAFALAREYPPDQMRIVQEGFKKLDLLAAAA
jgi:putative SOS response-associated peptidase YedK